MSTLLPKPHTQRRPLWWWVGVRMGALSVLAAIAVVVGMLVFYLFIDWLQVRSLPPAVAEQMLQLRQTPEQNATALWSLMSQYYDINDFMPGVGGWDLLALGMLILILFPVLFVYGAMLSRALSRQFIEVVQAARQVSEGDFTARSTGFKGAPAEIVELTSNFNEMAARLQQYEREVLESSAILTHELRTPLNASMGRIQGMMDAVFPLDERQLAMALAQLQQINRLIDDMHFVSLARAGQIALQLSGFDIGELVQERLEWAAPRLQRAGIVTTVSGAAPAAIIGDRARIGQAVSILIENVLIHAHHGKTLDIRLAQSPEQFVIEVADRGPGIQEADIPLMSDRFWRADASRARNSGGSGLGLAIASAICRSHQGQLAISPRPDGGLVIQLVLPATS